MPEKRVAGTAVTLGDYIYVMGGTDGSQNLLRYDPAQDSWSQLAPTLAPREHTTAVAYDGKIFLMGGRWPSPGELDSMEIYDPETDTWEMGPALETARAGFGAAVLNDQIYVLGGEIIFNDVATLNSVAVFDPVGQSWGTAPEMLYPLHGVPAAVVDGVLYLLGGADEARTANNSGRVLIYQIN
jgi:N-acetylneuraminic acid mutarotase